MRIPSILIIVITAVLVAVHFVRHRRHVPDQFVPQAATLRAGPNFCACFLVAIATGVFDALEEGIPQ